MTFGEFFILFFALVLVVGEACFLAYYAVKGVETEAREKREPASGRMFWTAVAPFVLVGMSVGITLMMQEWLKWT